MTKQEKNVLQALRDYDYLDVEEYEVDSVYLRISPDAIVDVAFADTFQRWGASIYTSVFLQDIQQEEFFLKVVRINNKQ